MLTARDAGAEGLQRESIRSYPRSTCWTLRMTERPGARSAAAIRAISGANVWGDDGRTVKTARADHERPMRIAEQDARAHFAIRLSTKNSRLSRALVIRHRPFALCGDHQRERREVAGKAGPRGVVDTSRCRRRRRAR